MPGHPYKLISYPLMVLKLLSPPQKFPVLLQLQNAHISSIAFDLVDVSSEENADKAVAESVKMDLELNPYIKAVQPTINHVKEEEKIETYY